MNQIFECIEIRHIPEGFYLAHELDECSEILLVDKGKYQVGFRVNNNEHMKLIFGESTRIGTYNVMFMVRHEFIIKSLTPLDCYSIRLHNIRSILKDSPQFTLPLKRKAISNYSRYIYFPLIKMKRQIISKFDKRKDFE